VKLFHDRPIGEMLVDVGAMLGKHLLGGVRREPLGLDQPATNDGRTAATPCFAVDVDFFPAGDLLVHKVNGSLNVVERGMCKIDSGDPQFSDRVLSVQIERSAKFFASIDDCADTQSGKPRDIAPEWTGSQNDMGVNFIPPMPFIQDSTP
jgi:hypothetical protein